MSIIVGKAITYGGGGVDTTDATATAASIKAGETAYVNEEKITGTMPNLDFTSFDSNTSEVIGYTNSKYYKQMAEVFETFKWYTVTPY